MTSDERQTNDDDTNWPLVATFLYGVATGWLTAMMLRWVVEW